MFSASSDALFYHSLGAFKQEVPSPTQDKNLALKQATGAGTNNSDVMNKRVHALLSTNDGNGQSSVDLQTQHSLNVGSPDQNNGTADIINSLQNHQQQQLCQIQQTNSGNHISNTGSGHMNSSDNVVNFQQILNETNGYNDKIGGNATDGGNARVMTPPQIDKPLAVNSCHSNDARFQYVLAAATSIATKNNEDTLTYLNQGQSYEIKLKKLGDLTNYRNKVLTVGFITTIVK